MRPKNPFSSHEIIIELCTAIPVTFWELLNPYPRYGLLLINSKDLLRTNKRSCEEADLVASKIVVYLENEFSKKLGKEL